MFDLDFLKIMNRIGMVFRKNVGSVSTENIQDLLVIALCIKKAQSDVKNYEEKFSLGYLALTFGKLVDSESLYEYLHEIEIDLVGNHFISELFKMSVFSISKENITVVNDIFNLVNDIPLFRDEDIYKVAFFVLEFRNTYGKNENYSSMSLSKLESELIDCQEGQTILDDFCGYGISANEIANNKGTVYLKDVNRANAARATILTYIKGTTIGKIDSCDSLLDTENISEKYDIVAIEPPFGMKHTTTYLNEIPEKNIVSNGVDDNDSVEIRHCLSKVKPNGKVMILVNSGLLSKSGKFAKTREKLLIDKHLDAVIEIPSGVLSGTNVSTALLILKMDKKDDKVYFFNTKDYFEREYNKRLYISDENIDIVANAYHQRKKIKGIAGEVSAEDIISKNSILYSAQYLLDLKSEIHIEDVEKLSSEYKSKLNELLEVDKALSELRS